MASAPFDFTVDRRKAFVSRFVGFTNAFGAVRLVREPVEGSHWMRKLLRRIRTLAYVALPLATMIATVLIASKAHNYPD